ncbi:XRE family transcriptional regulator [Psychromonas sp. MB-3u-54]|nr:XRE family transcriptional regulator [Psychromonas sp. MB-3u-54]
MSDFSRNTGINSDTLRGIFNETATRVELNMVETLDEYLKIEEGDLYELAKKNIEGKIED